MISGIRRDTDDTAEDGSLMAVNLRFIIDGEYRRRSGMERAASIGARSLGSSYSVLNGRFALIVTAAGVLEAVQV